MVEWCYIPKNVLIVPDQPGIVWRKQVDVIDFFHILSTQ